MKPRAMLVALLLLMVSATVLWAEDDPPGRVARLQYSSGSVSVQPGGTGDWAEAVVNRPLTASDNIWTDKDSRAELSVGTGIFRMNSETSVTFTNLSDNTIQVQLHQGSLNLHLRKLYGGEIYEVDTPNMAFTVQKSGDYRFDVQPEGDTSSVIVWKGKGDATGEGPAVRVEAHERATFSNGTTLTHTFSPAPELDGFDDWAVVRDQREDHYASGAYVSPDVIGARDLDDYGYWRTVPEYGPIWVPSHVAVGWAPYRYGHWVWVGPWGWTWVDDEPWGFAPFHYGRWVEYGGYWGWAPGPVYVRPVYAPALVAWFGGPRWGVSVGFGGGPGYGWCPLGWGEPFVPWYHGSGNYFRNVNVNNTHITNITNITNIYERGGTVPNRYIHMRSATAVPEHALLNSQPVYRNMVRVSQNEFEHAPRGTMGLAPTRNSMLGVNAGRPAAMPSQRTFARPVFSNVRTPEGSAREGTFNRGNEPASGAIPQREGSMRAPQGAGSPREGGFGGNAPMRNVPRPPNANAPRSGAIMGGGDSVGSFPRPEGARNAAQPPSPMSPRSGALENARPVEGDRGRFSRGGQERNVPRPPSANVPSNGGGNEHNNTPQRTEAPMSPSRPGGMSNPSSRSGAMENARPEGDRGRFSRTSEEMSVPRPPANGTDNGGGNGRSNATPQRPDAPVNTPRSGGMDRGSFGGQQPAAAPRPPANENRQAPPSNNNGRSTDRPAPPSDNRRQDGGHSMYVPRPSGPVRQASNQSVDYRGWQGSRGNSARDSYQGSSTRSYSAPQSYSSPRSYSAPRSNGSYGSYNSSPRSYSSSPRYSAPSGGGGHSGGYQGGGSSHSGYSGGSHSTGGGGHSRGRA